MCNMFREIEAESYVCQTRSVRLGGHVTSIRLEILFWQVLEEIAQREGLSLGRLLTKLYDETLNFNSGIGNFTALLRCACVRHVAEKKSVIASKREFEELLQKNERPETTNVLLNRFRTIRQGGL